jgi:hypothetical protein
MNKLYAKLAADTGVHYIFALHTLVFENGGFRAERICGLPDHSIVFDEFLMCGYSLDGWKFLNFVTEQQVIQVLLRKRF